MIRFFRPAAFSSMALISCSLVLPASELTEGVETQDSSVDSNGDTGMADDAREGSVSDVSNDALASLGAIEWRTSIGGNGHFYKRVTSNIALSWDQANAEAKSLGGHLFTISGPAEFAFLLQIARGDASTGTHLGHIGAFQSTSVPLGSTEGWSWVVPSETQSIQWGAGEPSDGRTAGIYCGAGASSTCVVADYPPTFFVPAYIVEFER
ncbi:MAG: hypothetical protein KBF88_02025 [Polyangiaceae bacterium]|nr:hypothetical protein [Polyangiaceae bacterium]